MIRSAIKSGRGDMGKAARLKKVEKAELLRLDFGCGPHKREGFKGVDQYPFDGAVDFVMNIGDDRWPWKDATVEEAHASHFLEHLTASQRIHFCNELYRVLRLDGACSIIVPHWASHRAYGDPTHQWPPVSEMWFMYLNADWRASQAPHTDARWSKSGFTCNFEATWGYSLRQDLLSRNQEYQQFAIANYKEVATDLIATITKRAIPEKA